MGYVVPAAILMLGALLLARPEVAAEAVRQGFSLCSGAVLPAMFPFFVLSSAFLGCGGGVARRLGRPLGRLFGVSGAGGAAFLLGLVGGYPLGARCVGELVRGGEISRQEAEHLLGFCSNCAPAFILQVVGLGVFGSLAAGVKLWAVHAAAAVMCGVLFRGKRGDFPEKTVAFQSKPAAKVLVDAVVGGGLTCVQVTAFISFFLVLLRLWIDLTGVDAPIVLGFFEMTNGVLALGRSRGDFALAAALLGWGGWCVHGQAMAVLSGCGVSMKGYFRGKAVQAVVSAVLAWFWA